MGRGCQGSFGAHNGGSYGGVVEERATPRASFAGHVLTAPWDKLQELYFVSYALWNYLATPFVFTEPGFETREIGRSLAG
jgi:hypothetical protein